MRLIAKNGIYELAMIHLYDDEFGIRLVGVPACGNVCFALMKEPKFDRLEIINAFFDMRKVFFEKDVFEMDIEIEIDIYD